MLKAEINIHDGKTSVNVGLQGQAKQILLETALLVAHVKETLDKNADKDNKGKASMTLAMACAMDTDDVMNAIAYFFGDEEEDDDGDDGNEDGEDVVKFKEGDEDAPVDQQS